MGWLHRTTRPGAAANDAQHEAGYAGDGVDPDAPGGFEADFAFVCSTCGRSDLPAAGDREPPICLECDSAINFDAVEEVELSGF